jgi:cysteine desulfurase
MTEEIYLDFNATTPVASEVLDAMYPWFSQSFWNAASAHTGGRRAHRAVETARQQVAELIAARRSEVVWTSGSTEANNLAIKGAAAMRSPGDRVLVAPIEHKAVLDAAYALESAGYKVAEVPVDRYGLVDLEALQSMMGHDVAVVSVALANNETGIIQPVEVISKICHEFGALMHTDATQAIGRIPVDVDALNVDLASMSAHKFHGPKGVGCLYVRRGTDLEPLMHGGGHERGMRSGTSNVPGVVGMGRAAELVGSFLNSDADHMGRMRDRLVSALAESGAHDLIGGQARLPNTANLRFPDVDADAVMANAPHVLVSSGSACTSRVPEPSHVLRAMGLSDQAASECIRFSTGRTTTADEVDVAIREITRAVQRVRSLNGPSNEETSATR